MTRAQLVPWLDAAVKAALVALLLYAVVRRDLPQFEGKGVVARALLYPIAALLVPAVWFARGRRDRYPFDVDVLLVLPFLVDTAGNAANLYDSISWWDDANHFVNWAILVAGFGRVLVRLPLGRLNVFGLALGFGGSRRSSGSSASTSRSSATRRSSEPPTPTRSAI